MRGFDMPRSNCVVLIEREGALAVLAAAADDASAGSGRLVFVAGEAGAGKTSLLRAAAEAQRHRLAVAVGQADGVTTAAALGPFLDALPDFAAAVEQDAGDRLRTFRALRETLAARPTLLVLEDLHWADEATFDALRYLGRRLDGLPVLIAATYRHDEVPARHPLALALGDLAGQAGIVRVEVDALSRDGVAALARQAGAQVDLAALYERTDGNPFYVTEVLHGDPSEVPPTVRDAVLARTGRLPAGAQDVLAAAAVLGGTNDLDLLTHVAAATAADLDACVDAGALVAEADGFGFRHELARVALADGITPGRRRELHRRALDELTLRDPSDHRTLAHHAAGAGDSAALVRYARLAAERAARLGAHREAAAHHRAALRGGRMPPEQRAELFEALSYECYVTGQLPEALTARQQALELHQLGNATERIGVTERWLSRLWWFSGNNDEAERYAPRAVATLEPLGPTSHLAMAYSNLAQLRMLGHDVAAAVAWGEKAIALARSIGDRDVETHALNNVGTARCLGGDLALGRQELRRSLDIALAENLHEHAARAYTNLGSTAMQRLELADASHYLRAGIAYCDERDLDTWSHYMRGFLSLACLEAGDFVEARAHAARIAERPDVAPISQLTALLVLALLDLRCGTDGTGSTDGTGHLARARQIAAGTQEVQRLVPVAAADAEAAWLAGTPEPVAELTDEAWRRSTQLSDPWAPGPLAWWRHLAGLDSTAQVARPFALLLADDMTAAAQEWDERGCVVWRAYTRGLDPDPERAREGIATLDRLGAARSADAVVRTRRERGLPLPRRPRAVSRTVAGQLSPREQEVLDLLADGLSTPEIASRLVLSAKTVEHHVGAVLRKLGEPTRARAVATARRQGLLPDR